MSGGDITYGSVWKDSPATVYGYAVSPAGVAILQSDLLSIEAVISDATDPTQESYTWNPSVSEVIYNTLQTNSVYTANQAGFNFSDTIPGAAFPIGDHIYNVEYVATPTVGDAFVFKVFRLTCRCP